MGLSVVSVSLQKLRKIKGVSRAQFAKEIGESENTIINVEAGYTEASEEFMKKVADYFDISVEYLSGQIDGSTAVSLSDFFEETYVYKESDFCEGELHEERAVGRIKVALYNNRDRRLAMRVETNDMKNSRIQEDDIVVIKVQNTASDNDIVVVRHEGKILIRRFARRGDTIHLFADPMGRKIPAITYKVSDESYEIIGKVMACAISF